MRLSSSSPPMLSVAAVASVLCLTTGGTATKTMNDGTYGVSNTLTGNYKTTAYEAEYFDVYSPPIRSQYSEVYWAAMDAVPLPDEIIQRFDNKTMAIVGYEVDQVRVLGDGQEIPVPINHAYNHHYIAWLHDSKKGSVMKKKVPSDKPHQHLMTHGSDEYLAFEYFEDDDDDQRDNDASTNPYQIFSEGNGGEMRLSYHGYPKGYAQLIHSPTTWTINPMQIDTWNRDSDAKSGKFVPGPLPKTSPALNHTNAIYSGLLECPCTDRLTRHYQIQYQLNDVKTTSLEQCNVERGGAIDNATECFAGAQIMVPISKHVETFTLRNDKSRPLGCSLKQKEDGTLQVYWNEPKNGEEESLFATSTKTIMGFASNTINATVALHENLATLTLVGPADRWFGMGLGATSMCRHLQADECPGGGPYAIIVYNDTHIEERKLEMHGKGTVLPTTLTVVSNAVDKNGNRTVVVTRPLTVKDEEDRYYNFSPQQSTLDVIMARGCNTTFAQHCGHGTTTMNFLAVDTPMRVCRNGIAGGFDGGGFPIDRCRPWPESTLLNTHNPTCNIQTYQGGLHCCKHGHMLLDKDQDIPWADQVLEYHMKFRIYFEDYEPATSVSPPSHHHLVRFYWMTEAGAGEYDITPCPAGTPPSQCIQVITSQWKVHQLLQETKWSNAWGTGPNSSKADGIELIYAGPHCHAPSCLSIELYNADTGDLLCHVEPQIGTSDKVYDELGFLAIPPCLWSDAEDDGLMKPVFLSRDTTLMSIKRNNNTVAHFGEMASWQMRGRVIMNKQEEEDRIKSIINDKKAKEELKEELASDNLKVTRTSVLRGKPEV